jgi:hypothetical protein
VAIGIASALFLAGLWFFTLALIPFRYIRELREIIGMRVLVISRRLIESDDEKQRLEGLRDRITWILGIATSLFASAAFVVGIASLLRSLLNS